MPDKKITHLLIDTSFLRKVGFNDPTFRLLLLRSQENVVKIFISHIAWEELRTQFLENARNKVRKVQREFDELSALWPSNFLLRDLALPTLSLCKEPELEARSNDFMTKFSTENKIEIVPINSDHADRAWQRYFEKGLPSSQGEERKKNRNDIPDLWIFEAAFDKKEKYPGLMALCGDERLSDALRTIGIGVFNRTQEVLDEIEVSFSGDILAKVVVTRDSASVSIQEKATATVPETGLDLMLAGAREPFKNLDTKILGYVGYLGAPSKDQLFDLLFQSGISVEIARNVTERLVIAGLITDTGNHYLSGSKVASDLAAAAVEPEIIKLLEEA